MAMAKEIMTPNPVCCQDRDTIYRAVEIMKRENVGVVPVVEQNNRLSGIITDRDICIDVILNNLDPRSTPVSQMMSRDLLTCNPDELVENILHQMERKQVKRIPVVDESGRIIGIISEADIARHLGKDKVGELAEGIYR